MQEKLDQAEKENHSLRSKLSAAVSAIVGLCQSIGMLDDYRGGEYSENSLSDRQSSLVSILREIGSEIVAKLGFKKASQDIDNTVKLPEQIEQRVEDDLEWRERGRGGMSR